MYYNSLYHSDIVQDSTSIMLLEDIAVTISKDDSYKDIKDTSTNSLISSLDLEYIRSKGFTLSNDLISSNIFTGIDTSNLRWTAELEDNRKKPIKFYQHQTERGKGLLHSPINFTREEFEERFN